MSIFTICLRSLFIGTFLLVAQAALATIEVIGTTPTSLNDCDGTITIIAVGSAGILENLHNLIFGILIALVFNKN